MFTIPSQSTKQWSQTNSGDVLGNLNATCNVNFDKEGYLSLSRRSVAVVYGATNFENVISIIYNPYGGNNYGIVTSNEIFTLTSGTNTLSSAITGVDGGHTIDGVAWQGLWFISQDDGAANASVQSSANGTSFTSRYTTLTFSTPHPLCVFESFNYLCIGNGNTVKMIDTSYADVRTLTLPKEFQVRWMRYRGSNMYIGTWNTTGGHAQLFVWNGSTTSAQSGWPIKGQQIFAGTEYGNSIAVMTSVGQLLRFNGGGFDVLANLPVYYSQYAWYSGSGYSNGKVAQRGMVADGDILHIVLDGRIGQSNIVLPNQPSGLWTYDPKVGLYHRAGFSSSKVATNSVSSVNTTTDIFTIPSYTAQTGTKVFYTASSTSSTNLVTSNFYYLIRVTSTTCKLASTYENAIAGTAIDLTTTGTSEVITICDNLDYGHTNSNQAGAITLIPDADSSPVSYREYTGSQLFYGGTIRNNTDTLVYTLQSLIPANNRGSFVTQRIFSSQLKDVWQKIVTKAGDLLTSGDKITVKYRTRTRLGLPITGTGTTTYSALGTWVAENYFTTTTDLTNAIVGDEISFLANAGAGCTAHILSLSYDTGTWTVYIDESLQGITQNDKCHFVIDNWKKLNTGTGSSTFDFLQTIVGDHSKWIQFKFDFRGVSEPYIEELQIINKTQE